MWLRLTDINEGGRRLPHRRPLRRKSSQLATNVHLLGGEHRLLSIKINGMQPMVIPKPFLLNNMQKKFLLFANDRDAADNDIAFTGRRNDPDVINTRQNGLAGDERKPDPGQSAVITHSR